MFSVTYATGTGSIPPAFDYLTVTAGDSTPLQGRTLAVDDTDSPIVFSGSWSDKPSVTIPFDYSSSLYRDTAHWTSTVGDSLQFEFEGSSISVFGIATNISSGGNITASYTLDGVTKVQGIPQGTLDTLPMVNLFHADVQPGVHTLIINITDIQAPRALGIDFITYNASFNSLSSVSVNASPSSASSSGGSSLNVGAKVGIALGAVASVALLGSVLFALTRHYLRRKNSKFPLSDTLESGTKPAKPRFTW